MRPPHFSIANRSGAIVSIRESIGDYARLGFAAAFLLAAVEWIDLNVQLGPVLSSFSERLTIAAYLSVNLLVGLSLTALIGLVIHLLAHLKTALQRALARNGEPRTWQRSTAFSILVGLAAIAINQQRDANLYATSLLREAEKLPHAARIVLPFERPLSYLVIAGLLLTCSMLWGLTRHSAAWPAKRRGVLRGGMLLIAAIAYYVDSRVEVQQYEYSLHRTMFLVVCAVSLSLAASTYLSSARIQSLQRRFGTALNISATLVLVVGLAFTFARFDGNQNLKTQIFYRTTQAKQHFKILQWLMDADRDGYSSLLGGGDSNERNASVNPGAPEIAADGIDNNCIGGDLADRTISDWQQQFNSLHAAPNPAPKRYNVIYFFIDTLRADHLGAYGYQRGTSPNIDRLAERSFVFENAYSPSPYTYEAAPKFMQSAYWDGHFETWTESLARNGYQTILFPRRVSMLLRYVGGMQQVVEASRTGLRQTIDAAIDELGRLPSGSRFCAYIYSLDPHRPYRQRPGINFGSSLIDQYDAEVAYTDYHLGRLFDWMEKSGRMNDTMVIIMADHGESFGERMVYRHNSQLYDEQMKVPAIVYVPGYEPRRVADYVSTIDLAPTLLNIVGVDCPPHYAGVSLLPLMRGEPFQHPPVYGEHCLVENSLASPERWIEPESRKFMVITQDGYKLIYNRNYYCFELYDLNADPKEIHNLFDRMPDKSAGMQRLLGRFVDVVSVMRPSDANEQKHFAGAPDDENVK